MTVSPSARLVGFVEQLSRHDVTDSRIAEVAESLADSGTRLTDRGPASADFASTGGPTSLSTLLVPVFLRAAGFCVPTLAVPGRPAGGVDVLATVPGYRTDLDGDEVERILRQVGHVHFAAGRTWTPDDAELFALRQRIGAQARPSLVIASLIAKKLAVGVRRVGLDVRVASHGNFGATADEAEVNSRWFCRVSQLVGLQATCILTDASRPYQPFLGRGEALIALSEVLSGTATGLLAAHAGLCRHMAREVSQKRLDKAPLLDGAREALAKNLDAQGAGWDALDARVAAVRACARKDFFADTDGFAWFGLDRLREALVRHQRETSLADSAGVVLRQVAGAQVARGDVLISLRCDGPVDVRSRTEGLIRDAVGVLKTQPPQAFKPLVIEEGSAARPLF